VLDEIIGPNQFSVNIFAFCLKNTAMRVLICGGNMRQQTKKALGRSQNSGGCEYPGYFQILRLLCDGALALN